jgi:hypothetical protein
LVNDEDATDSIIQDAIAVSTPKDHPPAGPQLLLPSSIQDEIHLKNGLKRQGQVTTSPALKAQINSLQR